MHIKFHEGVRNATSAEPELEFGCFGEDETSQTETTRLVVASYNIRYAVGSRLISGSLFRRAGLSRPQRRAALVNGNINSTARAFTDGVRMPPADVIALQEADRETLRAGGQHVAQALARALRMNYVRAGARTPHDEPPQDKQWYLNFEESLQVGEEGDTGVALLSRLPLMDATRVELPWSDCAWRPRLAVSASVPFVRGKLRVFNAHIDPHAGIEEQLAQHRAVLAQVELDKTAPAILLGDFNTLSRSSRPVMRALLESHGFQTPLPTGTATWRSGFLRLHADWIFVRGARVLRWGVARRLSVSDHWPVWVEIEATDC